MQSKIDNIEIEKWEKKCEGYNSFVSFIINTKLYNNDFDVQCCCAIKRLSAQTLTLGKDIDEIIVNRIMSFPFLRFMQFILLAN